MTERISDRTVCPQCRGRLDEASACGSCGQSYPRLASVRVLLPTPTTYVEHWRRQLGLVVQQGMETRQALEGQAAESGVGPLTGRRLQALGRAIGEQVEDLARVLVPALGGPLSPLESTGLPRGATDYLPYLHRDWAWSEGHDGDDEQENERAFRTIRRVIRGRALGRTLVVGAGACRLAYDLHVRGGATDTAVVDVDPYLLVTAEAVIRGGGAVSLTETSVNAPEVDPVSRRWTLSPPAGPLGPEVFQFFLADGLEPPFADDTFDTIVTPWFIDQVPTDLEALLRRLHGLLAPGGRWINHGPLIYRPDAVPIVRWYTRQEIFELAERVGFEMGAWERMSQPYLVSPLTGRGMMESVLTFEAVRVDLSQDPRT